MRKTIGSILFLNTFPLTFKTSLHIHCSYFKQKKIVRTFQHSSAEETHQDSELTLPPPPGAQAFLSGPAELLLVSIPGISGFLETFQVGNCS